MATSPIITAPFNPHPCHKHSWTGKLSKPHRRPLYTSYEVKQFIDTRFAKSYYLREVTGHCRGCSDVYEEATRVLANLLAKLDVI